MNLLGCRACEGRDCGRGPCRRCGKGMKCDELVGIEPRMYLCKKHTCGTGPAARKGVMGDELMVF